MVELKFWHAVAIIGVIALAIIIYGVFVGGIPGIPNLTSRTVTIYTETQGELGCNIRYVRIVGDPIVGPSLCTPLAGDPQGDLIVTAYEYEQAKTSIKVKSNCVCDVWHLFHCLTEQTVQLCLNPGYYTIRAEWRGVITEKEIVVS